MRKKNEQFRRVAVTGVSVILAATLLGAFLSRDAISVMYEEKKTRAAEVPELEKAFQKQIEAQRKLVRTSTTVGKEELDREQNPARVGEEALPNPFEPLPSDGQHADQ